MRTAWVFLVSLSFTNVLLSQRFPERWITFNPIMSQRNTTEEETWEVMSSAGGWGGFGGYRLLRDDDHAWVQELGVFVELFRFGSSRSLAFVSNIEFIANANNDIRFNPRAIFWEEGFIYTIRQTSAFWQIGYFHRCKHDVDNLLVGTERSLIFGSLLGKYLIPFTLKERGEGLIAFRADVYTIRQDDRIPSATSTFTPHVKRMLGTLGFTFHLRETASKPIGWYTTGWGGVNFFGKKEGVLPRFDTVSSATIGGGLSAGIMIIGAVHFRIGVSYEYQPDTGINPIPVHSHLLSIGIKIVDPTVMW